MANFPRKSWAVPATGQKWLPALTSAELQYNIPNRLLARVAYQESRFRNDIISGDIVSSANAQGIMQIVPRWHPDVDPLEPYQAIDYAGHYLSQLYKQFGSWDKALGAYNWGPGNMKNAIAKHGEKWLNYAPEETRNYVRQITADVPIV